MRFTLIWIRKFVLLTPENSNNQGHILRSDTIQLKHVTMVRIWHIKQKSQNEIYS